MPKAKSPRTHILGGCGQCRRRHVKCDQTRPACGPCHKANLLCDGYASNMRWVGIIADGSNMSRDNEANTKVRRQLYSEESRKSMSLALASQVQDGNVAARLNEVTSRTRKPPKTTDRDVAQGPFGVIDFQEMSQESAATTAESLGNPTIQNSIQVTNHELLEGSGGASDLPFGSSEMDYTLQWDDLFALDFADDPAMGQDDLFLLDLTPELPFEAMTEGVPEALGEPPAAQDSGEPHRIPTFVLSRAEAMLKQFQNKTIPSMAGLPPGIKSPWKIQNVASAVQTLAELTYLERRDMKHAKIANLYALFACASYQLDALKSDIPGDWNAIFNYARHEAKKQLQASLREEMTGTGKAKYKDQLMAIMGLVSVAVISGNTDDARKLIIDTERLLRTRGLAKRYISRKCRMLHHIYTWTRIIGESTYVLYDYEKGDAVERQIHGDGVRSTGSDTQRYQSHKEARLDSFLRFPTTNHEEAVAAGPKDPVVGLYDIHLDDPRNDRATMYEQIYGLPEPWLSLLSRTTKLANVMDAWRISGQESSSGELSEPIILQKRVKTMEKMVCSFAAQDLAGDPSTPNYHMTRALTAALVIYFYRRIRDVDPWIMQSHVDNVISALKDYDNALQTKSILGPGTAWPAFIAGCEALTRNRRQALSAWIDRAFQQTGLWSFKAASEHMTRVWRRRDEVENRSNSPNLADAPSWTWFALSRERNEWILLC